MPRAQAHNYSCRRIGSILAVLNKKRQMLWNNHPLNSCRRSDNSNSSFLLLTHGRGGMSDNGYFRAVRSRVTQEINKDPNALSLLYLIARRARWHDGPNLYNLAVGEALIGDYEEAGFKSRQEYRS